jgi:hypothetical protein
MQLGVKKIRDHYFQIQLLKVTVKSLSIKVPSKESSEITSNLVGSAESMITGKFWSTLIID